jgi:hypothetical protein
MGIPNTYACRTDILAARGQQPGRPGAYMKQLRSVSSFIAVCLALVFMAACHRGSVGSITINLNPNTVQSLDAGHSQTFTATLAGDTTNKGVKWTLTLNSNLCSTGTGSGCGTLSQVTTTSVLYTAPPNVSSATSVTLTATSIYDPIISANVTINIDIAPQFTTTSIPSSAMNGVPYTATVVATGGVAPLTYSISSAQSSQPCGVGGNLPCGLTLNPKAGTIVGTPTYDGPSGSSLTSNFIVQVTDFNGATAVTPLALAITVAAPPALSGSASLPQGFVGGQYTGAIAGSGGVSPLTFAVTSGTLPPTLAINTSSGQITGLPTTTGTFPFTVTITDSALPTHQTFPVSGSIAVNNPPGLQITTTSLPAGVTASGYDALLQAKGGIPPYTWSLVSGQLPPGLNLATQSDSTGLISGNPILAGSSTFTVELSDSNVTPATLQATYTIPVTTGTKTNSLFSGTYTFLFQGFDQDGPVSMAGTLTADGNGNITSGFEDVNRVSGNIQNSILSGTYSIGLNGADGRGTLHLISTPALQNPLIVDYQLVLESSGVVHMIENNNTNGNTDTKSTHGAGVLKPVSQGTFTAGNFSGNYALRMTGADYSLKPMAIGGILHADGVNLLSPIVGDLNDAGSFAQLQSPSGTFSFTATTLRGTANILYSLAGKAQTQLQFAFYFVSSSDVFFVETDIPSITDQFPHLSGEAMLQQTGTTFGASSFSGVSVITGTGLSGSNSSAMAGLLTVPYNAPAVPGCNGAVADASLSYDQNSGGTTSIIAPAAATCVVASNGRAAFNNLDPRVAVAYLTGPGQGFFLGSDAAVTTGLLELQTPSTFATSMISGTYALSAAPPGDSKTESTVGQMNSSTLGSIVGTLDEVDAPGTPAHLGQSLTLSVNSVAANGRGTMGSNSVAGFPTNLVFYMLSPSQMRLISLDSGASGSGHPDVISLNH